MLSEETNTLIGEFLVRVARTEKKLEVIRQMLCEFEQFEPYSSFQRLDRLKNNYISPSDLHLFLKENQQNAYTEEQIAKTFIQHYDYDEDGILCFAEFLRGILPADQPILRTLVSQRPIYEVSESENLDDEIEYTLTKLFSEEINSFFELEDIKQRITSCHDFSFEALLEEIDLQGQGFIDFNNLFEYFKKNAFYPYEEEIIAILRRLDKNDDGRLTLAELREALAPKDLVLVQSQKGSANKKNSKVSQKNSAISKNIEENIEALNNKIYSANSKYSRPSTDREALITTNAVSSYNNNSKNALTNRPSANKYNEDQEFPIITERKSKFTQKDPDLTEKKSELQQSSKKKSSVIREKAADNYEEPVFSNKKSIALAQTTPPRYPRPVKQSNQGSLIERTPPAYQLYPYEPVRRAFSPMKEQILKSSRTPPRRPENSDEKRIGSQKKARDLQVNYEDFPQNIQENQRISCVLEERNERKSMKNERNSKHLENSQAFSEGNKNTNGKKQSYLEEKPKVFSEKKSVYREILHNEQNDQSNDEDNQETYEENPQKKLSYKQNFDDRPRVSSKNPEDFKKPSKYYEEDQMSFEDKRNSFKDNQKKASVYQEKPLVPSENKRISSTKPYENIEKVQENRHSKLSSSGKPLDFEDPRASLKNTNEKKPSIYQEKPSISSENKRLSNKLQEDNYKRFSAKEVIPNQEEKYIEKRESLDKSNKKNSKIYQEKPTPSSEDPQEEDSEENERVYSKHQEKKPSVYGEKPVIYSENKRFSNKSQDEYKYNFPAKETPADLEEESKKRESLSQANKKKRSTNYQEKPASIPEEKRGSVDNTPSFQQKPQIYSENQRISFEQRNSKGNIDKESAVDNKKGSVVEKKYSVVDKEAPINEKKASIISEKKASLINEKKASVINEKKASVLSESNNKKGSFVDKKSSVIGQKGSIVSSYEKPMPIQEEREVREDNEENDDDNGSNVENDEKSFEQIQEKARLQSLKIDEMVKNELNNNSSNKNEKKTRNSDLGVYSKQQYRGSNLIVNNNERKSAPLILAHNSFNKDLNESNTSENDNNNKNKNEPNRKKTHSVNVEMQVKEEPEDDDEEEENAKKQENPIKQAKKSTLKTSEPQFVNNENNINADDEHNIIGDIVKYIKTLLNCEEELERCKEDLALRPDFNLVDFFLFFDKEKMGYCVKEDFQEVLREIGINFQEENVELFLKRFTKLDTSTLKFYDFSEAFLPLLVDYAEILNQRKPINIDFQFKYRELFSPETRRLISQTMRTHFENEECLEAIREALVRKDQNIQWENLFEQFDLNKDGFITDDELQEFMEINEISLSRKEIEMIYERVDQDKDGKISFEEFRKELEPRLSFQLE